MYQCTIVPLRFSLYCKLDLSLYYILYYNIIYNIYIILPFFALHTDNENANGTMVQWYKNFEAGYGYQITKHPCSK